MEGKESEAVRDMPGMEGKEMTRSSKEIRAVCTIKDLVAKGYPEHYVRDLVTDKRYQIGFKMMPANPKSRWLIDIEKFNAHIEQSMKLSSL